MRLATRLWGIVQEHKTFKENAGQRTTRPSANPPSFSVMGRTPPAKEPAVTSAHEEKPPSGHRRAPPAPSPATAPSAPSTPTRPWTKAPMHEQKDRSAQELPPPQSSPATAPEPNQVRSFPAGTQVWFRDAEGRAQRAVVHSNGEAGAVWLLTDSGATTIRPASDLFQTEAEANGASKYPANTPRGGGFARLA
jgi:hypothetical protein